MIFANLAELLQGLVDFEVPENIELNGIRLDSRDVKPGDLFVGCVAHRHDAVSLIDSAFEQGAVAALVDVRLALDNSIAANVFYIENLDVCRAKLIARYYGKPSVSMNMIGITGTNGKTSCGILLAQLLNHLNLKTAYVGTLGAGFVNQLEQTGFTTPPVDVLQKYLYKAYSHSARAAVLEVSSHAISQNRIAEINFDTAVFTNLSRDHLDYHESMQDYAETKARLFQVPSLQNAVINIDDKFGEQIYHRIESNARCVRVSLRNTQAEVFCQHIRYSSTGVEAEIVSPEGIYSVNLPLLGEFNLSNMLLVLAVAYSCGYSFSDVVPLLSKLDPPCGRMQLVGTEPLVVVDYAHTPDAISKVCHALRVHVSGRIIIVFGCGGDRDVGKRSFMGQAACRGADVVVLTNDNPRSEAPDEIIEQILQGVEIGAAVLVKPDRAEAIETALATANVDDCVIIAGKGHEKYQDIAGVLYPFDDVAVVSKLLTEAN